MAFINFELRLSALEFCKDSTAQIAAGIQPMRVICKIRQIIQVRIFPLKRKEIHGKNIAISVIMISSFMVKFTFRIPAEM
jgi:hypothetical protein